MLTAAAAPSPVPVDPARLLAEHAAFTETLACRAQARRLRQRGAEALLAAHPDLTGWMRRPVSARLAEVRRLGAWPFLSWCFATGVVVPDLELLVAKGRGAHFTTWARLHAGDVERARTAGRELGWCEEYLTRVAVNGVALVCLSRAVALDAITVADLDAVGALVESLPLIAAVTRKHLRAEAHGLRLLCYQLGVVDVPPRHGNVRDVALEQRVADIPQPEIRRAVLRYLQTIGATVRPKTVEGRAATLRFFAGWLADTHPDVSSLRQLTRTHLEAFLTFDAGRASRGRAHRGRPISTRHHARTVHDLRAFFEDLVAWDWAERPTRILLHRSDLPRLPQPLPRARPGRRHRADGRGRQAGRSGRPVRHRTAARRRAAPRRATRPRTGLPMGPARARQLAEGAARQAERRTGGAAG